MLRDFDALDVKKDGKVHPLVFMELLKKEEKAEDTVKNLKKLSIGLLLFIVVLLGGFAGIQTSVSFAMLDQDKKVASSGQTALTDQSGHVVGVRMQYDLAPLLLAPVIPYHVLKTIEHLTVSLYSHVYRTVYQMTALVSRVVKVNETFAWFGFLDGGRVTVLNGFAFYTDAQTGSSLVTTY